MGFNSVRLFQFRNLEDAEVLLHDKEVFLVGKNGQGKTNFLEAIYLLSIGSSFRTKKDALFIKNGCKSMSVAADFTQKNNLKRKIKLKIENGQKIIFLDEQRVKDRKELLFNFPCIPFTHNDINYVTGPPVVRRLFLNQTISLFNPSYIDSLREYSKLIKLRNKILKDKREDLLNIYDIKVAETGLIIQQERQKLIDDFNMLFSTKYKEISESDIELNLRYSPNWKNCFTVNECIRVLEESRNRDLSFGTSTTGPHRDRLGFYYDKINYASIASTGQIRLISLVLKAAQAAYISKKTEILPVLLLDDVLLEMDLVKRQNFINHLPEYEQAFFTFLPDEGLIHVKKGHPLYRVQEGKIIRGEN